MPVTNYNLTGHTARYDSFSPLAERAHAVFRLTGPTMGIGRRGGPSEPARTRACLRQNHLAAESGGSSPISRGRDNSRRG